MNNVPQLSHDGVISKLPDTIKSLFHRWPYLIFMAIASYSGVISTKHAFEASGGYTLQVAEGLARPKDVVKDAVVGLIPRNSSQETNQPEIDTQQVAQTSPNTTGNIDRINELITEIDQGKLSTLVKNTPELFTLLLELQETSQRNIEDSDRLNELIAEISEQGVPALQGHSDELLELLPEIQGDIQKDIIQTGDGEDSILDFMTRGLSTLGATSTIAIIYGVILWVLYRLKGRGRRPVDEALAMAEVIEADIRDQAGTGTDTEDQNDTKTTFPADVDTSVISELLDLTDPEPTEIPLEFLTKKSDNRDPDNNDDEYLLLEDGIPGDPSGAENTLPGSLIDVPEKELSGKQLKTLQGLTQRVYELGFIEGSGHIRQIAQNLLDFGITKVPGDGDQQNDLKDIPQSILSILKCMDADLETLKELDIVSNKDGLPMRRMMDIDPEKYPTLAGAVEKRKTDPETVRVNEFHTLIERILFSHEILLHFLSIFDGCDIQAMQSMTRDCIFRTCSDSKHKHVRDSADKIADHISDNASLPYIAPLILLIEPYDTTFDLFKAAGYNISK